MRFIDTKYKIDSLNYVILSRSNKNEVVYWDENQKYYININTNTTENFYKRRIYSKDRVKVLCNFSEIIKYENIWLLLIDSEGKIKQEITNKDGIEILNVYRKIGSLTGMVSKEIDYIAGLVTYKCLENILPLINKNNFNKIGQLYKLLKSYIYIDLGINGLTECKLIINKEGKFVDYKILRVLKYLGISINVHDIPDFKIEYNLEGLNYYDFNGNKIEQFNSNIKGVEKIKKFNDKFVDKIII